MKLKKVDEQVAIVLLEDVHEIEGDDMEEMATNAVAWMINAEQGLAGTPNHIQPRVERPAAGSWKLQKMTEMEAATE